MTCWTIAYWQFEWVIYLTVLETPIQIHACLYNARDTQQLKKEAMPVYNYQKDMLWKRYFNKYYSDIKHMTSFVICWVWMT